MKGLNYIFIIMFFSGLTLIRPLLAAATVTTTYAKHMTAGCSRLMPLSARQLNALPSDLTDTLSYASQCFEKESVRPAVGIASGEAFQERHRIPDHPCAVLSVAVDDNNSMVATGCADGRARVFALQPDGTCRETQIG